MTFLFGHPTLALFLFPGVLFLGMLALLEVGRRAALRRLARDPEGSKERLGAIEGAIFGLLGLLTAFTFSGAAERFERRRDLVVQEANALGDAWARLETLPPATQPALRDGLRRYLESRIETYRRIPDMEAAMEELARSVAIQDEVWSGAVAACATPEGQRTTMLVLPGLEAAFDMTDLRTAAAMSHPPLAIYLMLGALALAGALIAGFGMIGGRKRNLTYMIGLAATMAAAVYVILDLEFPRIGLIRVDAIDRRLTDLLDRMR